MKLLAILFLALQPFQTNCFVLRNTFIVSYRHKIESKGPISTTVRALLSQLLLFLSLRNIVSSFMFLRMFHVLAKIIYKSTTAMLI